MTDSELFVSRMKEHRYSYNSLAECMGITQRTLFSKVNNAQEFKASEISILCKLLHINLRDKELIFFKQ